MEDALVSTRTRPVSLARYEERLVRKQGWIYEWKGAPKRYSLKNSLLETVKEGDIREKLEGLQGCIPYRYKNGKDGSMLIEDDDDEWEVLVVSSQKSPKMMFPKGGWELDESVEEAASRESLEEAGVLGNVQMSVDEAKEACEHCWWMKEALEILVDRLITLRKQEGEDE
ncbi:hypothetical protein AgCh_017765 [Apium graveolens]